MIWRRFLILKKKCVGIVFKRAHVKMTPPTITSLLLPDKHNPPYLSRGTALQQYFLDTVYYFPIRQGFGIILWYRKSYRRSTKVCKQLEFPANGWGQVPHEYWVVNRLGVTVPIPKKKCFYGQWAAYQSNRRTISSHYHAVIEMLSPSQYAKEINNGHFCHLTKNHFSGIPVTTV